MTVDRLRARFDPAVVVMVGIAGLIREETCAVGDVVVATEVVYYDDRRLQEDGEVFRPHERVSHIAVRHSVNELFNTYGEPFLLRSAMSDASGGSARVHFGKMGSGEAVIDMAAAAPVGFLRRFDSKVLGVDTESGGLSHAFVESPGTGRVSGWLVIRSFSDTTVGRSDKARQTACKNAARVLEVVLPHLAVVR